MTIQTIIDSIEAGDFTNAPWDAPEFGGADVIITREASPSLREWAAVQPLVLGNVGYAPRRRLVETRHAVELSWLLYQFRELYGDILDSNNKYYFYGMAAQAAIEFIADHGDETELKPLLMHVIDRAELAIGEILGARN